MNIAFVANGKKTAFFNEIGKCVQKKMNFLSLFYICFNNEQYQYYLSDGISHNNILYLSYSRVDIANKVPIGEYKLNELVAYDRIMKYDYYKNIEYMCGLQSLFYDFINNNHISYVFGEMTWAPEVLMARICKDKFKEQCVYLHPQSIRIPNGRFSLMDTEFQDGLYKGIEFIHDNSVLEEYELPLKPIVPQRVADVAADVKNQMKLSETFLWILKFLTVNRIRKEHKDIDSYQTMSTWDRRCSKFKFESNKLYYKYFLKTAKWEEFKDKKFLFVALHMQPEASVDVVGRYYDNQLQNIINLWRILPYDYHIVVKEHTNAIANRGYSFFHKLKQLRNIIIANENISSHQIICASQGVFTNSGTVALESALFQKHSFLFSTIFFDKLKYCHRVTLDDLKECSSYEDLKSKCIKRDAHKMDTNEYSEYIIRSSLKGIIDPHRTSYLYTDRVNIETIADSFIYFFSKQSEYENT